MTRDEQIMQYAMSFKGKGIENEELKDVIRLAIVDGAKWADEHPDPSWATRLKLEREALTDNFYGFLENLCTGHNVVSLKDGKYISLDSLCEQFKKHMEQ